MTAGGLRKRALPRLLSTKNAILMDLHQVDDLRFSGIQVDEGPAEPAPLSIGRVKFGRFDGPAKQGESVVALDDDHFPVAGLIARPGFGVEGNVTFTPDLAKNVTGVGQFGGQRFHGRWCMVEVVVGLVFIQNGSSSHGAFGSTSLSSQRNLAASLFAL